MLTVIDSALRLLSVERLHGLNVNVSTLKELSANHGYSTMLTCDDVVEFPALSGSLEGADAI